MQHVRRIATASVLGVAAALCISTGTAQAATPVAQPAGLVMAQGAAGGTGGAAAGGATGGATGTSGLLGGIGGLLQTIFGIVGL